MVLLMTESIWKSKLNILWQILSKNTLLIGDVIVYLIYDTVRYVHFVFVMVNITFICKYFNNTVIVMFNNEFINNHTFTFPNIYYYSLLQFKTYMLLD